MSAIRKRPHRAILVVLLLLAFGLRVYRLDALSFWTDEGLTPLRAGYDLATILSNKVTIQAGVTNDTHPPLYFLLIHVTRTLFGETDFAYRYPSVLAGLLLAPLLLQLGRRLHSWRLGIAAAVLTAVNPLQIWYAHEARMYTLYVLLMATAVYLLWRALNSERWRAYLPLYLLFALLAFYTHYTAVFILASHALFWAWLLWQRGHRRLLIGLGILAVLAAVPLVPFTWPRLFTGAEANYTYVPPATMLKDIVHFFFLGLTTDFSQWWIQALDVGTAVLLTAGLFASRDWRVRLLLAAYLLATVFGLMAGSLIKPMYQGVRHIMVGSPAFMLLAAWGLIWLWQQSRRALRLGAVGGLLVLATGTAVSLTNLYTNPAYAKDDFRGLVRLMEQRAGHKDLIIYNNAVQLPLHRHYQQRPDVDATALPVYPFGATGSEPELADFAASYDRIWFARERPADGRDDLGLIEGWLDNNLTQLGTFTTHARTTVVEATLYDTRPLTVGSLPQAAMVITISPNPFNLQGWQLSQPQPLSGPTLWLDLFWQASAPPAVETLAFRLIDGNGQEWGRFPKPVTTTSDAARPQNGLLRQPYHLTLPAGLPPGGYTLELLLGAESLALGQIQTTASSDWPLTPSPPAANGRLIFANGLTVNVVFPDTAVRPGSNLPLTLYWRADAPLPNNLTVDLIVSDGAGAELRRQSLPVITPWLDPLPAGTLLAQPTGLYFRPETAPGDYTVTLIVRQADQTINGRPPLRPWTTAANAVETITVTPWPLVTEPPNSLTPANAMLGNNIRLHSTAVDRPDANTLTVTLVWEALATPQSGWFAFVHLVDDQGNIVRQFDRVPVDGLRPTQGWRPGEFLVDRYTFSNLNALPAGEYTLTAGLFAPDSFQRPPLTVNGERLPNDQYPLATVTLP